MEFIFPISYSFPVIFLAFRIERRPFTSSTSTIETPSVGQRKKNKNLNFYSPSVRDRRLLLLYWCFLLRLGSASRKNGKVLHGPVFVRPMCVGAHGCEAFLRHRGNRPASLSRRLTGVSPPIRRSPNDDRRPAWVLCTRPSLFYFSQPGHSAIFFSSSGKRNQNQQRTSHGRN